MIDEKLTLNKFGYTSEKLSTYSDKKVIVICDYCGNNKETKYSTRNRSLEIINKDCCIKCQPIKTKESNIKKFGQLKNPKKLIKRAKTFQDKYGGHPFSNTDVKNKIKQTINNRYSSDNIMQSNKGKELYKESIIDKYGTDNVFKLDSVKNKIRTSRIKSGSIKLFDNKGLQQWAEEIGFAYTTFQQYVKELGFEEAIKLNPCISSLEQKLITILENNHIEYIKHYHIDNKVVDLYIPKYNLLIEADGLYWHSDACIKDYKHHINRREFFINRNYNILFFRENEINDSQHIVESVILNKCKLNTKIYARKCEIKKVERNIGKEFLTMNHLMGNGFGIYYGLYYDNILICLMQIKKHAGNTFEISRYCTKNKTSIIGGFSKLLRYVENLYKPSTLFSFVDLRYGGGEYLLNLGFAKTKPSPSFCWIKNKNVFHRMKFPSNTGYDHGCYKLWDCGQLKFIKKYT